MARGAEFQVIQKIPIVVIVAIAATFRLVNIDQPLNDMFSWREASTAMMADNFWHRSWNIFYPEVSWTGPGSELPRARISNRQLFTALLYALFGWHVWFGRLVAACFGIWGVFAFHRLIDRVWGCSQANAGALMLAVMPGRQPSIEIFCPIRRCSLLSSPAFGYSSYICRHSGFFFCLFPWQL